MNDSMIYLVIAFIIALAVVAFWRVLLVLLLVCFIAMVLYSVIIFGHSAAYMT